jgi:hypothetical protein
MYISKQGTTRIVFVFSNKVLKIPTFKSWSLFLHGLLSNINEGEVYNNINRNDLAKVYYYNKLGLFLIMERVSICSNEEALDLLETLEKIYQNDTLKDFIMDDYKTSNWGRRQDGTLVKVDYGS